MYIYIYIYMIGSLEAPEEALPADDLGRALLEVDPGAEGGSSRVHIMHLEVLIVAHHACKCNATNICNNM